MRLLGIDYGDARTGIAVSDPTGMIALEAGMVESRDPEYTARKIAVYAASLGAESIVLGHPVNMNATCGPRSEKTKHFAEILQNTTGLPVVLWDERLTTSGAERILHETGIRGKQKKARIDALAAVLILQGYLDYLRLRGT